MGGTPELWHLALPRLLAVAYGAAMVAALLIRLLWRRGRWHLSTRSGQGGRHARPPLKSRSRHGGR